MTYAQIRWAMQHDWFSRCLTEDTIEVFERWVEPDGSEHETRRVWDGNFSQLRDWAGY